MVLLFVGFILGFIVAGVVFLVFGVKPIMVRALAASSMEQLHALALKVEEKRK